MLKTCLIVGLILLCSFSIFSQSENYSVAAKWGFYSVKKEKISFLMPRLPILIEGGNQCRGENTKDYAAYTDGVAFTVRITSKTATPDFCYGTEKKKFDEKNFTERINELKQNLKDTSNDSTNTSKDSVVILTGTNKIVRLINDFDNKRWFEFAIYGEGENKTDVKNFLDSLKKEKQQNAIEIAQGAEQVFGDVISSDSFAETKYTNDKGIVETLKGIQIKTESKAVQGITIILKPRANYTDAARQGTVQGKVVLRVTFMANGAVGEISVISGLGNGLTEEAVKAAKKIVFLPAQRDGARYSVTKPVEYSFTIY
jgi:TonB family protein